MSVAHFIAAYRERMGVVGVRDPEHPCEDFNGRGYEGRGRCKSDGHYLCTECSELSPEASRFVEYGRDGRRDRLILHFAHLRRRSVINTEKGR